MFGSTSNTNTSFGATGGGGMFGNNNTNAQIQNQGTEAPFVPSETNDTGKTSSKSVRFMQYTEVGQYKGSFSSMELRLSDYAANRKEGAGGRSYNRNQVQAPHKPNNNAANTEWFCENETEKNCLKKR